MSLQLNDERLLQIQMLINSPPDKMSNHSSQNNVKLGAGWLPIELLTSIIEFFVAQTEILPFAINTNDEAIILPTAIRDINILRLVCKDWCTAATPFAFHTVYLYKASGVKSLLHTCRTSIGHTQKSLPVKKLRIANIWYSGASHGENSAEELQDAQRQLLNFEIVHRSCPVSIDQAADAIILLGHNLIELTLRFSRSITISPYMLRSIKEISSLKKLRIFVDQRRERNNDSESISALLNATPTLESLMISFSHLDVLNLKPQALPNLKHLWFRSSSTNIEAVSQLCNAVKDSVKVIEYNVGNELSDLGMAIEPMKESLEGLFCTTLPRHLPNAIIGMRFPRLRVMRSLFWLESGLFPDYSWLQWPILQSVRTFAAEIHFGRIYWKWALEDDSFQKPTNLKHFICITGWRKRIIDESLAKAFKARGITCHFMLELRPHELLVRIGLQAQWANEMNQAAKPI
ncbi:uncharacterized protein MELLADRAFT_102185 [Melampsora larici-populina 98AG31]|uniref:Uncharacterized protein n=1 Tax=Melampsora larici-populina (strain 98AG31 / pathotype 3-4-7) TaxID=747676 RepID=F4R7G8_MELLP|nr:uncharacterized protein MELLADRAFT_102185 [Melampsora larici-populina 98AG31]EGG11313.1 hypothetical protein MELLADRAFT_102185 [Melampsora larici-populina 98AG31]